jgi:hypothetical protein
MRQLGPSDASSRYDVVVKYDSTFEDTKSTKSPASGLSARPLAAELSGCGSFEGVVKLAGNVSSMDEDCSGSKYDVRVESSCIESEVSVQTGPPVGAGSTFPEAGSVQAGPPVGAGSTFPEAGSVQDEPPVGAGSTFPEAGRVKGKLLADCEDYVAVECGAAFPEAGREKGELIAGISICCIKPAESARCGKDASANLAADRNKERKLVCYCVCLYFLRWHRRWLLPPQFLRRVFRAFSGAHSEAKPPLDLRDGVCLSGVQYQRGPAEAIRIALRPSGAKIAPRGKLQRGAWRWACQLCLDKEPRGFAIAIPVKKLCEAICWEFWPFFRFCPRIGRNGEPGFFGQ